MMLLGKSWKTESQIISWHTSGRRLLCFYHPVTIYQLLRIKCVKPGFHLQQKPRPRHKKQSDYVVEQSSFPLIALFWLKNGRCRGRKWLYGNQV